MPRYGRHIATPTPPAPGSTTLLGSLSQVAGRELEDRRQRELEATETKRRRELEDLQKADIEQRMGVRELEAGITAATARRDIFGVEEIPGTGGIQTEPPLPELPTEGLRTRTAGEGGGGVGVRAQLPAGREPLAGPAPQRIRARPPLTRRLEPARDPTIVNPEFMESEFNFGAFEGQLDLPTGSLGESFRKQPAQTLNLLLDKLKMSGSQVSGERLNSLRQIVQTRINAVQNQLEFSILDAGDEQRLQDEIDTLTHGLIEAATGYGADFDRAAAVREIQLLYPDETREEKGARLLRVMAVQGGASEFAGAARGQLEPRR